ncbi:MAG: hypothetical protein ACFB22_14350 [Rhodothalassiaceae bacterium]
MKLDALEARAARQDRAVAAARACVGTPFRHQGRQPGHGLDCVGLILQAARELGLAVSVPADYGRAPDEARLPWELARAGCRAVPVADQQSADILLFCVARRPRHLALRSDRGMVHAWAQSGRVVEHRISQDWAARLVSVYRFPGL